MSEETASEGETVEEGPTYTGAWEMVDSSMPSIRQFRQSVPGGWLILCSTDEGSSTTFLPDAERAWQPPIKQSRKKSDFFG
ncbi:MAG: hypothetical protein JKY65_16580 [Planctomycetes bacterium]|nr:hypothetical protein [Planctomycetota bacterium]